MLGELEGVISEGVAGHFLGLSAQDNFPSLFKDADLIEGGLVGLDVECVHVLGALELVELQQG